MALQEYDHIIVNQRKRRISFEDIFIPPSEFEDS